MATSSNFTTFVKAVSSAGTAEVLVSVRTEVRSATIQADGSNTGSVTLRDAVAGADGIALKPLEVFTISAETYDTFDLRSLWIKVATNGDKVNVTYEV